MDDQNSIAQADSAGGSPRTSPPTVGERSELADEVAFIEASSAWYDSSEKDETCCWGLLGFSACAKRVDSEMTEALLSTPISVRNNNDPNSSCLKDSVEYCCGGSAQHKHSHLPERILLPRLSSNLILPRNTPSSTRMSSSFIIGFSPN